MKSTRFYLACLRDNVGSCVGFHLRQGGGYNTDLDRAVVFTREEAQKAWASGREIDLPLCADRVDALAVWRVDCQHIPDNAGAPGPDEGYVAYKRKRWDGNDVYWLCNDGEPTTDFSHAAVHPLPGNQEGWRWLPLGVATRIKRRTLSVSDLNRRTMVQAAGLVTPDHVARQRRRRPSDKTRWNCPGCGKIHWQLNPYDFEGCNDMDCEAWRPSYASLQGMNGTTAR